MDPVWPEALSGDGVGEVGGVSRPSVTWQCAGLSLRPSVSAQRQPLRIQASG